MSIERVEQVATKITIGSGSITTASGAFSYLSQYQSEIAVMVSIIGATITLLSFCIMWRYKYLENKRAQELHDAKILERRINAGGRRKEDMAAQICPLFSDCEHGTQDDDTEN